MPNTKDIAFVACRLMSLYLLIISLPHIVLTLYSAGNALSSDTPIGSIHMAAIFVFSALPAVLFFWFGANWISSRLILDGQAKTESAAWSRSEALSLATTVLGLFVILTTIPSFVSAVFYYAFLNQAGLIQLLTHVLALILGILCLMGPKTIADFVTSIRRW